jgi:hypothetical protein
MLAVRHAIANILDRHSLAQVSVSLNKLCYDGKNFLKIMLTFLVSKIKHY